jgi:hypothetical protein
VREDEDETGRRIVSIVHVAMLAAVPLYVVILWFVAGSPTPPPAAPGRARIVEVLLAIGAAEWGAASLLGRAFLRVRGPGPDASDRIRRYFLVRFAAAEAIGVFGLFAGFTGSPLREACLLFAASALALLLSSPTRTAWARALALTQQRGR